MADMVGSAVVGETVNRIISSLIGKHEEQATAQDSMERLEMAHIKMEAAIETSNKWCVTDVSLLRWRKRLKRAAQECDDTLRKCKQRAIEDEEIEQGVKQSSFPKRIAYATKSFVSSFVAQQNYDVPSTTVVRRFERFADGAGEFLRYVEFGSTRQKYTFFDPLIGHLLAGRFLWYKMVWKSQYHYFGVLPISSEERGLEASILFGLEDCKVPKKNFRLALRLRLSESTDIIGTAIKCLHLFTTHPKSTIETAEIKLTQLPTQDISHGPYIASSDTELWNFYNILSPMFRPNPFCCKEHEYIPRSSNTNTLKLSNIFPEPVSYVYFHCRVSPLKYDWHRSPVEVGSNFLKGLPPLEMGVTFMPHASPKDLHPGAKSSALQVIDGVKQQNIHTNVSPRELEEMLLPKAIDCFYHKDDATTYEMFWKSTHGAAHLTVEKAGTQVPSSTACKTNDRAKVSLGWCACSDASSGGTSPIALMLKRYLSSKGRALCLEFETLLSLLPEGRGSVN